MKKITITPPSSLNRKLVAVVGFNDSGLFFRRRDCTHESIYFNSTGASFESRSLEELLMVDKTERKPVYEGDLVTIQF